MKTHRILLFISAIGLILLSLLQSDTSIGATKTVSTRMNSQIDPIQYIGGVAQLEVVTQYPIQTIIVFGVNQYGDAVTWPEELKPKDFGSDSQQTHVKIENWWWRFRFDCYIGECPGFPKPEEISPYVFIRYTSGAIANQRCLDDGNLDDKWATCNFPAISMPVDTMTCDDQVYYGVQHCKNEQEGIHTILVDLNDTHVRVKPILSSANPSNPAAECNSVNPSDKRDIKSNCPYPYPFETIPSMLKRIKQSGAVAIINADYFGCTGSEEPFPCGSPVGDHGAEGLTVRNGTRLDGLTHGDTDGNSLTRTSLAFSPRNRWIIDRPTSEASIDTKGAYYNVVGGGPIIVSEGNPIEDNDACSGKDSGIDKGHCTREYQSAAGITRNNILVLGTASKQADALAKFLATTSKVLTALKFDGGGSAHLAWLDHNGAIQEWDPSSANRPVAEGLAIFSEKISAKNISRYHILPGETINLTVDVIASNNISRFNQGWEGSDIVMSLISPSGRVINRASTAQDVIHELGPNFESYMIFNSEPGTWQVSLFGAVLPPEGEYVTFEYSSVPEIPKLPQLAFVENGKLILNMGSSERRQARLLEVDEINEEFVVKQLTNDLPGEFSVTAFGMTQYYAGVTSIFADADDGNDVILLETDNATVPASADFHGGIGDDNIKSGNGNDTLFGGGGDDQISGGGGDDTIDGNDGSDTLNGEGGQDTINGSVGADILSGGPDADSLHGDDGDDRLAGDEENDTLYGDAGKDLLQGGTGDDLLDGGSDDDKLEGNDGADKLHGGDGSDMLYGQAGPDELYGETGADSLYGGDGNDLLDGGVDNDILEGNDGADVMHGGTGVDKLMGNAGDDEMYGDDDADTLYGNPGNDVMHGNGGDDYLEGNEGDDSLYGDAGQDDLIGGTPQAGVSDGGDHIFGGSDPDVIAGDNAQITRPGGVDPANGSVLRSVTLLDVQIVGGEPVSVGGNDTLAGDEGDDWLFGQGGSDSLSGGDGNDALEGNAAGDVLHGDSGVDDLIGGGSANDGVIDADRRGDGLLDQGDQIYGGEAGDVLTGDNARITRPTDSQGHWLIDPNTGECVRQIVLFDVEGPGLPVVNPLMSGSDQLFGEAGKDQLFGQGNGPAADVLGTDPSDGIDNDRNGRENGSNSGVFDCLDGRDNDLDNLIDAADPQCVAAIDDNAGGDELHGGLDSDYLEGNHGADWMFGDDGEDDLIGGSSAGDGVIGGLVAPTGLRDGNDTMNGGGEDDVLTGDNAQIFRPRDTNGLQKRLVGGLFDLSMRDTRVAQAPEPMAAFGHDWMSGGDGVDDLYGQLGNDYIEGNEGEDAIIGDLGKITNNLIGLDDGLPDPGMQQSIAPNAPFFDPGELIYKNGSLYRQVELYAYLSGAGGSGNDTIYGGAGDDALHGSAGNDILNGNAGDDHIFGGDDSDASWGGPGHDTIFGGYGIDYLDVLPRPARVDKKLSFPEDPATWFEAAIVDNYQGLDILYGGWDRDWMQADVSAPGRVNGDRMIDWAGGFNAFYRCDAAYGDWVITRQHSPSLVAFLQTLAQAYGAVNTATPGTSGFRETGIVFSKEIKDNANPPNPDNPAHFVCGPAK